MDNATFREKRESMGFTQDAMAEFLGVTKRQIANFENGTSEIKGIYVEKIASFSKNEVKPLHVKEIEYHLSAKEKEMIMAYRNVNEITQREIYHLVMLKEIEATKAGELSELKAV